MNQRAVALRIELVHKVDDQLYPRVILLTVSLLTAFVYSLIINLMRIIQLVLVYLALNVAKYGIGPGHIW
jgi:hypothetical protein